MDMRELGLTRQTDEAQGIACGHHLPGLDEDAVLGHVAILGFPAVAMVNHHPLATFDIRHIGCVRAALQDIRHPVAGRADRSRGRGQNCDTRRLCG